MQLKTSYFGDGSDLAYKDDPNGGNYQKTYRLAKKVSYFFAVKWNFDLEDRTISHIRSYV